MRTDLRVVVTSLAAAALFSCGDSPQLVFPENEELSRLTGYVYPSSAGAMVYVDEADPIDSAEVDTSNGFYAIDRVPFGSYRIRAVAEGYGAISRQITVNNHREGISAFYLSTDPSPLDGTNPSDSAVIDSSFILGSSNYFTDTSAVIRIRFDTEMDTASVHAGLTLQPSFDNVDLDWYSVSYDLRIHIPLIGFLMHDTVRLSIDETAATVYGEHLDIPIERVFFPDSSCLDMAVATTFLRATSPVPRETYVSLEPTVEVDFRYLMDKASVESAFTILPQAEPNFFWSAYYSYRDELVVEFANPLRANTTYTITLDTGMVTDGSVPVPRPISFSFTTTRLGFTDYYPYSGRSRFPVDSSFEYTTNFEIDSASFVQAFTISPLVDSLEFEMSYGGRTMVVSHAPLSTTTDYVITIDSTLANVSGSHYTSVLTQRFTTDSSQLADTSQTVEPDTSFVGTFSPSDTTTLLATSGVPQIRFSAEMARRSVEQRITLSPSTVTGFIWTRSYNYVSERYEDHLAVSPSQLLRANTLYTLVLGSGYQTALGDTGVGEESLFKTEPIELTNHFPFDGQVNYDREGGLRFTFNTLIDTSTFLDNVTLSPTVDSLSVVCTYSELSTEAVVEIEHATFIADTSYTITLGTGIADLYGVPMGRSYEIGFATGE